ncbi:MAG: Fe-S cluster domain-containing protein [Clostridia bacterium]|nr:Fe-S cluster domain-containing protein [Clostridia bacterium]
MNQIWISVLIIGGMGLLFGLLLGIASKIFAVETDERIPQITEILPGANCGGCGFAGCNAYATAVVEGGAAPNLCPVGGNTAALKIAGILGVEAQEVEPKVARVLCNGNPERAVAKYLFDGAKDCHSVARLGGGDKMCSYGCLGFGSCMTVCPADAISIDTGVAVIDPEKCGGCGACVQECPKNVIQIFPAKSKYFVTCNSNDKGKQTRQNCQVGCIGCGICVKNCPKEAISMENNLAVIDAEKCVNCGICAKKCPQHAINTIDGLGVHFVIPPKEA